MFSLLLIAGSFQLFVVSIIQEKTGGDVAEVGVPNFCGILNRVDLSRDRRTCRRFAAVLAPVKVREFLTCQRSVYSSILMWKHFGDGHITIRRFHFVVEVMG